MRLASSTALFRLFLKTRQSDKNFLRDMSVCSIEFGRDMTAWTKSTTPCPSVHQSSSFTTTSWDSIFRCRSWVRTKHVWQSAYFVKISLRYQTSLLIKPQYRYQNWTTDVADQIGLPDFAAGAMENWGLITYRESILFYDPATAGVNGMFRTASVVAHEQAHHVSSSRELRRQNNN